MNPDVFYDMYISKDFTEKYVPHMFEDICSQYLIQKNIRGEMNPVIEKIGKYYYDDPVTRANGEFDVVTYDNAGYVFYDVKFKNNPISRSEMEKEIEQVKATGLACYKYVFVSKSGFEGDFPENATGITLRELYM